MTRSRNSEGAPRRGDPRRLAAHRRYRSPRCAGLPAHHRPQEELIISGGFYVYPSEVEQAIWGHPAVEDCAVVGAPDADWGGRVTAVVELKPGRSATAEEVKQRCRDAFGPVRAPKDVLFVDQLPRSVNGKVLKKDVRGQFWADQTRAI
ncbi:hypothetical protein ACH347_43410 [Saccharopolyspora sp. 5N102]|uniref:AMP-binding enzyme n=1 Tax=Saccharopolyspora sp. 5N102 TaxID=3375155 RepID=UPI003798DC4F